MPVRVLEFGQQFHQSEHRVGSDASVHAGVQIPRRTPRFDLGINQPAQPHAERRDALGVQFGVGNQRHVGLQLGGILSQILRHRLAADLFLAFDQKLHIDRQLAFVHRAQGLDGLDVHVHLTLIVGRAAGINVAVAQGGFKRRGDPFFQRIGRLDVVMPVAQHRRFAGSVQPVRINQRMPRGGDHLDVFHARFAQAGGHKLGRAAHIGGVFRERADAGNPQQFLQLFQQALAVGLDKIVCGLGHNPLYAGGPFP